MRKWLIGPLLGVVLLALGWGLTVRLLGPFPGITKANIERIRNGMSSVEVEGILGRPADATVFLVIQHEVLRGSTMYWHGDAGKACVEFNMRGEVIGAYFEPAREQPFSVRLRSFLGL